MADLILEKVDFFGDENLVFYVGDELLNSIPETNITLNVNWVKFK